MYTDRNCHSIASGPYDWLLVDKPNVACMRASEAPSSACELRWTLEMVVDAEAVLVRLRPTAVLALACNISQ